LELELVPRFSRSNGECPDDCLVFQAVAGLSVGLVLADAHAKVLWLNRAAERLLGAESAAQVGHPLEHALKDPELSAFWQDALRSTEDSYGELSLRWPREVEVRLSVTRCQDPRGRSIGRALLIYDVTVERTVQVKLSQAVATRLLALTSGHMPPEPVASLTHQELRMLRAVGRGLGNDEIAWETKISSSTVRSHLKSLYRKLNLGSRSEAVSFAVRHHLV
jgi:DNA-binding CsgD family transcriptional regulator